MALTIAAAAAAGCVGVERIEIVDEFVVAVDVALLEELAALCCG
jgi:hypothetical protein